MLEGPSEGALTARGTQYGPRARWGGAVIMAFYGSIAGLILYVHMFPSGALVAILLLAPIYLPLFMFIGGILGGLLGFLIGPKVQRLVDNGQRWRLGVVWLLVNVCGLLLLFFGLPIAIYDKLSCWAQPGSCRLEPVATRTMTADEKAALDKILKDRARWAQMGISECIGDWCMINMSRFQDADVISVYGTDHSNVWAVQSSGNVVRWTRNTATVTGQKLKQIHGCGKAAYAIWGRQVYHLVDDHFVQMDLPLSDAIPANVELELTAIAGCSDVDLWLLGERADSKTATRTTLLHYDGKQVRAMQPRNTPIHPQMVWSAKPEEAWLLGTTIRSNQPAILRFDHGTWTSLPAGLMKDAHVTAVLGLGDSLLVAGGLAGTGVAYLWDGKSFQETKLPAGTAIRAARDAFEGGAWAIGEYNTLYHWDNEQWQKHTEPLPGGTGRSSFLCLHASAQTLWVGGTNGLLLRRSHGFEE